jgi:hypothetical protein
MMFVIQHKKHQDLKLSRLTVVVAVVDERNR